MQIVVKATPEQKNEWLKKPAAANVELIFTAAINIEAGHAAADVFFDLAFDEQMPVFIQTVKPVFVNAVITVLDRLPSNYIRINAWKGFLDRELTEVAATEMNKETVRIVMEALGWKYLLVPDVPGMVAARTISMIINEAYYALGDDVSSKTEIDIAMKLGTNYPYGPFEWGERIGIKNIFFLIQQLNESDPRYAAAPLLQKEAIEKISNFS